MADECDFSGLRRGVVLIVIVLAMLRTFSKIAEAYLRSQCHGQAAGVQDGLQQPLHEKEHEQCT